MVKIAITGKMCSGKTTIAKYIMEKNNNFIKLSFADKVKELASDLFDMKEKDRYLLQSIGTKMREIKEDVWASYTVKKANNFNFVVIDDLRYKNEFNKIKESNFIIIKLNISKNLQINRLKKLYKNSWQNHIDNLNHQSELELDNIDDKNFDLIINVDNEESVFNEIDSFIKNQGILGSSIV